MRHVVRVTVGCLCLILYSAMSCFAKEWRGIVPLKSTRSDVIKLLGEPKHLLWDYRDYFILEAETVTFTWIDPTCVRKYPVEPDKEVQLGDLVLSVSVIPKTPLPRDEFHSSPLKFYSMSCLGNSGCIFMDNEEGFSYSTSKDGITGLSYGPTAEEYKVWMQEHKACRSTR